MFVLSSHTAIFQLLFYPLFVPISVLLHQTGTQGLFEYIKDGFRYVDFIRGPRFASNFLNIFADVLLESHRKLFRPAPALQIHIHIWYTLPWISAITLRCYGCSKLPARYRRLWQAQPCCQCPFCCFTSNGRYWEARRLTNLSSSVSWQFWLVLWGIDWQRIGRPSTLSNQLAARVIYQSNLLAVLCKTLLLVK